MPASSPSRPPTPPPAPTPSPVEKLKAFTAEELLALVGDHQDVGRVALARASLVEAPLVDPDPRRPGTACKRRLLANLPADLVVFDRSGAAPDEGLSAFRVLDDALERVALVELSLGGLPWTVAELAPIAPTPGTLYPVEAWLIQSPTRGDCAPAPDNSPDANYEYWCGASCLTPEPVDLEPGNGAIEEVPPVGLQVQRNAHTIFAPRTSDEAEQPWRDVYLIRTAGCPTNVLAHCPVWELVTTLNDPHPANPAGRADCWNSGVIVDGFPETPQQMAQRAESVLIATVLEIGPGFWDSASGQRPTSFSSDSSIHTRVTSRVEEIIKGDATWAQRAVKRGGTYGCDSQSYSPSPDLSEGLRYVIFLNHWTFHDPNLPQDAFIDEAWPVSPDDRVRIPQSSTEWVPVDALASYLLEATASPR